jgi:hypothetical protein
LGDHLIGFSFTDASLAFAANLKSGIAALASSTTYVRRTCSVPLRSLRLFSISLFTCLLLSLVDLGGLATNSLLSPWGAENIELSLRHHPALCSWLTSVSQDLVMYRWSRDPPTLLTYCGKKMSERQEQVRYLPRLWHAVWLYSTRGDLPLSRFRCHSTIS